MVIKKILILLVVGIIMLAGWKYFLTIQSKNLSSSQQSELENYTNIESRQLADMFNNKDFLLINVHIPYDGEIARTDAFIPFDEIGNKLNELPENKDAKIVLYCRSGMMSESAAQTLSEKGYTNLYNLKGGMNAWTSAGNFIIKK